MLPKRRKIAPPKEYVILVSWLSSLKEPQPEGTVVAHSKSDHRATCPTGWHPFGVIHGSVEMMVSTGAHSIEALHKCDIAAAQCVPVKLRGGLLPVFGRKEVITERTRLPIAIVIVISSAEASSRSMLAQLQTLGHSGEWKLERTGMQQDDGANPRGGRNAK